MIARIQLRNDTASAWTLANPVLAQGEMGIESDTLKQKIGDGSTAWNDLGYSAQPTTDTDLQTLEKTVTGAINEVNSDLSDHVGDTNNPHSVTATQVGLGNVDNTSDLTKMTVSTFSGLNTTDKTIVGAINEADAIKVNEVENSMLSQMPTMTIKGNDAVGNADPQDLTVAEVQTMLQDSTHRFVTDAKIAQWDSTSAGVNTGDILFRTSNTVPVGYLKANGALVSRTTYANLFALIGTTFGAGDGSTTFNLPDLRGEFIRGFDDGRGVDSGRVLGSSQTDAFQGHWHNLYMVQNSTTGGGGDNTGSGTALRTGAVKEAVSDGTNGTPRTATETRPRNIALMAIIKY